MAFLKDAYDKGLINVQPACFSKVVERVYEIKWHVYLESTLKSPIYVVKYLAAYANRVAIANTRIVSSKNSIVRFSYYDRKSKSTRMEKLDAVTFIQRFVQHIPPQGLVKIRYYGILANRVRDKVLPICRDLLEKEQPRLAEWLRSAVAGELLKVVAAPKGRLCTVCNIGHLQITGWSDGLVKRVGANGGDD
ncbi:MAG: transposase [Chitinispirillaceae bacterium]|nr:transposase [Chitinispirillaceae bacterium]